MYPGTDREEQEMREIDVSVITDAVERMCISANVHLPKDMQKGIKACRECEDGPIAQTILDQIIQNFETANTEEVPICQDTGMACIFVEVGQEVHFTGGYLYDAIHEGVRRGYTKGYLRKSVEADPIRRGNTGDNTPAMITVDIVPGDKVKITVAPKGFGSENMSALRMFKPSAGLQGRIARYYITHYNVDGFHLLGDCSFCPALFLFCVWSCPSLSVIIH